MVSRLTYVQTLTTGLPNWDVGRGCAPRLGYFQVPINSLLRLHERSPFHLKSLKISCPRFTPDEVIQFLRLQPCLETICLYQCDESGDLFRAFTYRGATGSAQLTLLRLTRLEFCENYRVTRWHEVTDPTPGPAVAEFAESLVEYPGDHNPCFPLLGPVHLYLDGIEFPDNVEDRLASVCSAGYLIDHEVEYRRKEHDYDSEEDSVIYTSSEIEEAEQGPYKPTSEVDCGTAIECETWIHRSSRRVEWGSFALAVDSALWGAAPSLDRQQAGKDLDQRRGLAVDEADGVEGDWRSVMFPSGKRSIVEGIWTRTHHVGQVSEGQSPVEAGHGHITTVSGRRIIVPIQGNMDCFLGVTRTSVRVGEACFFQGCV
ncbi:hypothetical protein B0H14DRAFT_2595798 [Mycena olivaceomarginata]|nr:hypothetical protein B0H14DRAFT_2595798 [Mycena olivaceomarginata]